MQYGAEGEETPMFQFITVFTDGRTPTVEHRTWYEIEPPYWLWKMVPFQSGLPLATEPGGQGMAKKQVANMFGHLVTDERGILVRYVQGGKADVFVIDAPNPLREVSEPAR
jgi:hypothetical protein